MNKRSILVVALVLASGCALPAGNRPLTEHEEALADQVADLVETSEECRDWSQVRIYEAQTQEEFYGIVGHCASSDPANPTWLPGTCPDPTGVTWAAGTGYHFFGVGALIITAGHSWDEEVWDNTVRHEVLHWILTCEGQGDGSHERPEWDMLAELPAVPKF